MSLLKQKPGYLMFLHGSVFQYFCFAQNAFRWMFILSLSFQVYQQNIVNSDPRTGRKTMVGFSYSKVQEQNIWWNLSLINQLWGSLSWWFWILWWIHWAWVRTSSWMGHWSFSDHISWGNSSQPIHLPACFFGRREETHKDMQNSTQTATRRSGLVVRCRPCWSQMYTFLLFVSYVNLVTQIMFALQE